MDAGDALAKAAQIAVAFVGLNAVVFMRPQRSRGYISILLSGCFRLRFEAIEI